MTFSFYRSDEFLKAGDNIIATPNNTLTKIRMTNKLTLNGVEIDLTPEQAKELSLQFPPKPKKTVRREWRPYKHEDRSYYESWYSLNSDANTSLMNYKPSELQSLAGNHFKEGSQADLYKKLIEAKARVRAKAIELGGGKGVDWRNHKQEKFFPAYSHTALSINLDNCTITIKYIPEEYLHFINEDDWLEFVKACKEDLLFIYRDYDYLANIVEVEVEDE